MTAISIPAAQRFATGLPKWAWLVLLLIASGSSTSSSRAATVQPHDPERPLFQALNELRDWIRDNRDSLVFEIVFGIPRTIIDTLVEVLTAVLHGIGWPALIAIAGVLGLPGRRLAHRWSWRWRASCRSACSACGSRASTRSAPIIAAVAISFLLGVPLGILMAAERAVPPVPDADPRRHADHADVRLPRPVRPASSGSAPRRPRSSRSSTRCRPRSASRRSASGGSRGTASRPAARSARRRASCLTKVRLPLARPEIGLALNQTIMLALSMIVITALIDAPGLGQDIVQALQKQDVGAMFDAGRRDRHPRDRPRPGDRAHSERMDPRRRGLAGQDRPRGWSSVIMAISIVAVVVGLVSTVGQRVPGHDPGLVPRARSTTSSTGSARTCPGSPSGFKDAITNYIINPLQTMFTESPWLARDGVVAGLTLLASGVRQAVVAVAVSWRSSSSGSGSTRWRRSSRCSSRRSSRSRSAWSFGILSSRSDRFARGLRPILDAMQTMPSFVYILPAFVLFDVEPVHGHRRRGGLRGARRSSGWSTSACAASRPRSRRPRSRTGRAAGSAWSRSSCRSPGRRFSWP